MARAGQPSAPPSFGAYVAAAHAAGRLVVQRDARRAGPRADAPAPQARPWRRSTGRSSSSARGRTVKHLETPHAI
jgi:hypothetical protein